MPANGRWDLIHCLKVNGKMIRNDAERSGSGLFEVQCWWHLTLWNVENCEDSPSDQLVSGLEIKLGLF